MKILIKTLKGLENVLANELQELDVDNIKVENRLVSCEGRMADVYRCNYLLRTALRVLVPIKEFNASSPEQLYKAALRKVPWSEFLNPRMTFAIDPVVHSEDFPHSKFAALKLKDAIVDYFREKYDTRPSVDVKSPQVRINLHISGNKVTIALDSSGQSLHLRGYREKTNAAPINEVLAAGLIQLSGWEGTTPFIDGMCGSGTLLIEAMMYAFNIPAGYYRKQFGFEFWNSHQPELWKQIREEADEEIDRFSLPILGGDISRRSIEITKENLNNAGLQSYVTLENCDFKDFPAQKNAMIILNPPYGERLEVEELSELYKLIGDKLKKDFVNSTAWVISSDMKAIKLIGLRPSKKLLLHNGGLECKFHKFEMYEGSKKSKYA